MKTNLVVMVMTVLAAFGSGCASTATVASAVATPGMAATPLASRPMRDAKGRLLFFTDPGFTEISATATSP